MDYVGGRYNETRWDVGPPHPPNGTIGVITHNTTGLNHWRTPDGGAPKFAQFADGNWHRFTVELYAGDVSGHRGERWWMDGVLMFDNVDNVGDFHWNDVNGGNDYTYLYPVAYWMVFGNYANGATSSASPQFTVDFDDWIAWTK